MTDIDLLSSFNCRLERAQVEDLATIAALEEESYPQDEAATKPTIVARQQEAGAYFYVARDITTGAVEGFINGTKILTEIIHHESMTEHQHDGKVVVIHSVTIAPHMRRKKLGGSMLKEYVAVLAVDTEINRILLLSKGYLLRFYQDCGFTLLCLSSVQHGLEPWFEMGLDLKAFRFTQSCSLMYQVDAFTDKPFGGNPAAIVFTQKDDVWMQSLATENNLAETAFIRKKGGINEYDLRWFTPTTEVELCGHATLATAHALIQSGHVPSIQHKSSNTAALISFHTLKSGILTALENDDGSITLDFPSQRPDSVTLTSAETTILITALHLQSHENILYSGRNSSDLLVEITEEAFERMKNSSIDFRLLADLGGRGVIITKRGGQFNNRKYDFTSRCFFPCAGIDEDPVTGNTKPTNSAPHSHLFSFFNL